jgi:hypothetical protein
VFDSDLLLDAVGPREWRLARPLVWTGSQGDTFTVPVGFRTDFATVPRVLRSVVEPYGAYTRAAVLHDYLLSTLGNDPLKYGVPPVTSQEADAIFRKVMHELGVGYAKRWSMWAAVRWGALFNADRAYGRRFAADLPKILPISLLAVPFLAPAAVGNLISLTLARLVTWSTPPVRLPRRGGGAAPKGKLP